MIMIKCIDGLRFDVEPETEFQYENGIQVQAKDLQIGDFIITKNIYSVIIKIQ